MNTHSNCSIEEALEKVSTELIKCYKYVSMTNDSVLSRLIAISNLYKGCDLKITIELIHGNIAITTPTCSVMFNTNGVDISKPSNAITVVTEYTGTSYDSRLISLGVLINEVKRVYNSNDYDWEQKYAMIFSDFLSRNIHSIIGMDYYSPDTSYEEDVRAYVYALLEHGSRTS